MVMRGTRGGFGGSSRRSWLPAGGAAQKLAIALVAVSVIAVLTRTQALVALSPSDVLGRFWLWQPLTYGFLEVQPFGVIFGALITWQIGGALEMSWGTRRLLWFALGSTALAGILTVALSLLWTALQGGVFPGGTVMTTALWIAYGLSHSRAQLNFWGIPLSGNAFAAIGVGFVFLNGAFGGWGAVVPDAFGVVLAAAYVRMGSPRRYWIKFQSWRFARQAKSRSKHLRVIGRERNMPSDSDKYLH